MDIFINFISPDPIKKANDCEFEYKYYSKNFVRICEFFKNALILFNLLIFILNVHKCNVRGRWKTQNASAGKKRNYYLRTQSNVITAHSAMSWGHSL